MSIPSLALQEERIGDLPLALASSQVRPADRGNSCKAGITLDPSADTRIQIDRI